MSRKYSPTDTFDVRREGDDVLLFQDNMENQRKIRPSNATLAARSLPHIYGADVDFVTEAAPIKYTTRGN